MRGNLQVAEEAVLMTDGGITRREGLGLAGLALGAMAALSIAGDAAPSFLTKVDFKNPQWIRDTYAWMDGNLNPTNEKVDMMYPGALQPYKWPRESAGPMNRFSEHLLYTVKRKDVENARLTNLPIIGAWSRIAPRLPWMLMGQAPGNISYFTNFATLRSIAELPADLVAAARAVDPKYLSAPMEYYGPSLSSLETYAKIEKPASVPPGWTSPQPPALKTR